MWRNKKIIVAMVLTVLVLAGSIGGAVLANDDGDTSQPGAERRVILDRVCEIYQEKTGVTIDQEALRDSFAQAQNEAREAMVENRLQQLAEGGQITQEEADEYLGWWQARPDSIPFGPILRGFGGMRGCSAQCFPSE
ncbi:hypothetical protein ACFLS8_00420 [Chloroflexota bacterium]